MKTKIFTLLSFSVLTLMILMSFASATEGDVVFNPAELILQGNQGETVQIIFTITNTKVTDLTEIYDVPSDLISDTLTIASSNLEIVNVSDIKSEGTS